MRVSLLAIISLIIAVAAAENEVGFCDNLGSGSQTAGVNWRGVAGSVISVIPIPGAGLVGAFFNVLAQIGVSGFATLDMLIYFFVLRGHPFITFAKISGFWTPSPLVRSQG